MHVYAINHGLVLPCSAYTLKLKFVKIQETMVGFFGQKMEKSEISRKLLIAHSQMPRNHQNVVSCGFKPFHLLINDLLAADTI